MAQTTLRVRADNRASPEINKLKDEFSRLSNEVEKTQEKAVSAGQAVDNLTDEVRQAGGAATEAAREFDVLGREVFQTSAEAKKFGGVFRDTNGTLREANGNFAKIQDTVKTSGRGFSNFGGQVGKTRTGLGALGSAFTALGPVVGALGGALAAVQLADFAKGAVDAATQMQGFRGALTAVTGSAEIAEERLGEFLELARQPGLSVQAVLREAVQLQTLGVAFEDQKRIISEFGNALAVVGQTDLSPLLLGLRQIISRGRLSQEELNQITERSGVVSKALKDAFGSVLAEDIQASLDASGKSVQDFTRILTDQLAKGARAAADTAAVAFQQFRNSTFQLKAAIGDALLPAIQPAVVALTEFFDILRAGDLSAVPEPIRNIIEGAKGLFEQVQRLAGILVERFRPSIELLAPALGNLLGNVLELARSFGGLLEPAVRLIYPGLEILLGLIAKLAEDINVLIGDITRLFDWISSLWKEEEQLVKTTAQTVEEISKLGVTTDLAQKGVRGLTQELQNAVKQEELTKENIDAARKALEEKTAALMKNEATLARWEQSGARGTQSFQNLTSNVQILRSEIVALDAAVKAYGETDDGREEQIKALIALRKDELFFLEARRKELIRIQNDTHLRRDVLEQVEEYQRLVQSYEKSSKAVEEYTEQINKLTGITKTSTDTNTSAIPPIENTTLALAKLRVQTEDTAKAFSETLTNAVSENAITEAFEEARVASNAFFDNQIKKQEETLEKLVAANKQNTDEYRKTQTALFELRRQRDLAERALEKQKNDALTMFRDSELQAEKAATQERIELEKQESDRIKKEQEARVQAAKDALNAEIQQIQKQQELISIQIEKGSVESRTKAYNDQQRLTIKHYDILIELARKSIKDTDQLNAELVLLTARRDKELLDNASSFNRKLVRLSSGATKEIDEQWDITVKELEKRLSEVDTAEGFGEIERDFTDAQEAMLASIDSVLRESGLSAQKITGIMEAFFRDAEKEADTFADSVEKQNQTFTSNVLKDRLAQFESNSNRILHDWQLTLKGYEQALKEVDTESGLRQIEQDFENSQAVVQQDLIKIINSLGLSADEADKLIKEVTQTGETEAADFTDFVIKAFQRLSAESTQETERQKKALIQSYNDLRNTADGVGKVLLDIFTGDVLDNMDAMEGDTEDLTAEFQRMLETIEALELVSTVISDFGDLISSVFGDSASEINGVVDALGDLAEGVASGNPLKFFAAIPNLVNSLNDLQFDDADTPIAQALETLDLRNVIESLGFSRTLRQALTEPLETYIREHLVRSLLAVDPNIAPAVILQHESRLREAGFDFDFERDRAALEERGFVFPEQGNVSQTTSRGLVDNIVRGLGEIATQGQKLADLQIGINEAQRAFEISPTQDTLNAYIQAVDDFYDAQLGNLDIIKDITGVYDFASAQSINFERNTRSNRIRTEFGELTAPDEPEQQRTTTRTTTRSQTGTGTAQDTEEPVLQSVFRFSQEQRATLETLSGDIETAEHAVRLLDESSSPEEVIAAYQALGQAETAYYNQQLAFIDAGKDIFTDDALATARTLAANDLRGNLFDANQLLVRALDRLGLELVTMFTATSGLLTGTALAVQQIPEDTARAATQTTTTQQQTETETETETQPVLDSVFRFSATQRVTLDTLSDDIDKAADAVTLLDETSTPEEVIAAYQNLAKAETAYYNQQLAFIDAGVGTFTDDALASERTSAANDLRGSLFDANRGLVRNLEDIGYELVTMFTETSGVLQGTQLAIRKVTEEVAQQETTTSTQSIAVETDTEAPVLRSVFRYSAEQRAALDLLSQDIDTASNAVSLLNETSTTDEVIAAYQALGQAEAAYTQQQLAFIDEGKGTFTDTALATERQKATGDLQAAAFDANRDLVHALERLGFELVTAFTATSGFLNDTGLAIRAIPQAVEVQQQTEQQEDDAPLRSVFRFSQEQRATLDTLAGNIETAENAVRLLDESSSPEEVIAAYQALGQAETAYYNQQLAFIDAGKDIFTDDALATARTLAAQDLQSNLFDANQDLVRGLGRLGFELVTAITATSGLLEGTALAIQQIPVATEQATADTATDDVIKSVFRFSAEQRATLNTYSGEINAATNAIRLLNENSTPEEVLAAYTRLGLAEQAYYDKQIEFINAGQGIYTDSALETARINAGQDLQDSLFDANNLLVRALAALGLQLTTTLTDASGLLTGTALEFQQIPQAAVPTRASGSRSSRSGARRDPRQDIFIGAADSREDLNIQTRRAVEDLILGTQDRIGELRLLDNEQLDALVQGIQGISGPISAEFGRNRLDTLAVFSEFFGEGWLPPDILRSFEEIRLQVRRSAEDIDIETRRALRGVTIDERQAAGTTETPSTTTTATMDRMQAQDGTTGADAVTQRQAAPLPVQIAGGTVGIDGVVPVSIGHTIAASLADTVSVFVVNQISPRISITSLDSVVADAADAGTISGAGLSTGGGVL